MTSETASNGEIRIPRSIVSVTIR